MTTIGQITKTVIPNSAKIFSNEANAAFENNYWAKKAAEKEINENLPRLAKVFTGFAKKAGEVQNILINAAGTAFVAPFFIAFNPVSKTDKDTKVYSAWRQPVSALLAIATQMGITLQLNRLLDKMANKGELGQKYDLSIRPSIDYFKDEIRAEIKAGKFNPQELINHGVGQNGKKLDLETVIYNEAKKRATKKFNEAVLKAEKGILESVDESSIVSKMEKTANNLIKDIDKEITVIRAESLDKKIKRATFISENLDKVRNLMSEVLNIKKRNPENDEQLFEQLKEWAKQYSSKDSNNPKELVSIANEIGAITNRMRLTEKLAGLREKIMQFNGKSEIEISKIINTEVETKVNELLENKEVIKKVSAKIKEQKTKISNLNIQDLVAKIKEIFTIKNKNFFEEVVKTHISDIQASFKGYKDITGLLITLAMTPFTCMALNWIYPKFMDYFFPHLGNKANGGRK